MGGYEQPDPYVDPQAAQAAALLAQDEAEEEHRRKVAFEASRELARREAKRKADEQEESAAEIVAVRGSDVPVKATLWLWRERVPLGGLALLAGKGDTSKSTLFTQFAAWLTLGEMKGHYYGKPQQVLYVINEDSLSQTVVPRLIAHGADMDRVSFLKVRRGAALDALKLPRDTELLRRHIVESGAVCTFIDPLSSNVTGRKNDQADMRTNYEIINNLAESTRTTIWGLAHTRKAGAENVMEAIIGSSEQGNVARSVHGVVLDPEEDGAKLLSCEKLNVGQKHLLPTLRFRTISVNIPTHDEGWTQAPQVDWLDETNDTASDILEDKLFGTNGVDEAAQWLMNHLAANGGYDYSSNVRREGKKYNAKMLDRARKKAKVRSKRTREAQSRTIWYLGDVDPPI
jgi:hypothetical protein